LPGASVEDGIQAGMYVEVPTFQSHLAFLQRYFEILPLSQLGFPGSDTLFGSHTNKPLCFLTFDDGWYDFYTHAFPLLSRRRIPATVFLPTEFIGTTDWFWTDRLASLLYQQHTSTRYEPQNHKASSRMVNRLLNFDGSFESRLESSIHFLKGFNLDQIEEAITELSTLWNTIPNIPGPAFLTWSQVREMAGTEFITFGSHTANHQILTTLNDKQIRHELDRAREDLLAQKAVTIPFIPFCYPNGNHTPNIARMVMNAGYNLAVTTSRGWNTRGADPFTLKRISIHQDMTSTDQLLACRILGFL